MKHLGGGGSSENGNDDDNGKSKNQGNKTFQAAPLPAAPPKNLQPCRMKTSEHRATFLWPQSVGDGHNIPEAAILRQPTPLVPSRQIYSPGSLYIVLGEAGRKSGQSPGCVFLRSCLSVSPLFLFRHSHWYGNGKVLKQDGPWMKELDLPSIFCVFLLREKGLSIHTGDELAFIPN